MFFRANVKDNVIKVNTLWAHAFGYRANYPIENDKKYRPFRRDVYDTIEDLLSRHGLDGQACTLKTFCTAIQMVESQSGMIFKLFKLIFTLEEGELVHFPHFQERFCKAVKYNCPLSFRDISPYTDEI
ncbi:unnamed protein product [Hermetia illucens]|uniref:Uncharacterized protein n=2 Tax=Hermetia illucens TaxID=343691 RepID=A0A7R8UB24_HERIL|nr:unnamed protein product [Hermetia illucens]